MTARVDQHFFLSQWEVLRLVFSLCDGTESSSQVKTLLFTAACSVILRTDTWLFVFAPMTATITAARTSSGPFAILQSQPPSWVLWPGSRILPPGKEKSGKKHYVPYYFFVCLPHFFFIVVNEINKKRFRKTIKCCTACRWIRAASNHGMSTEYGVFHIGDMEIR